METEMSKSANAPPWRHSYVKAIFTYILKKLFTIWINYKIDDFFLKDKNTLNVGYSEYE